MPRAIKPHLQRFLVNESGATAIEYGLLVAMMAVVALVAFGVLGGGLQNLFGTSSGNNGAGGVMEAAATTVSS